jgi:hypothetical protein
MLTYATQQRLQRKCACDHHVASKQCSKCQRGDTGLQTKLQIGAAHDSAEQEADRVADRVMSGPAAPLSAAPLRIQRQSGQERGRPAAVPESVEQTLAGTGRALDSSTRSLMEARFGHDFSRVRVHTGSLADRSAHDVSARAYTVGTSIVFGAGRYDPTGSAGRHLLAHELAHVVQQGGAPTVLQRAPVAEKEVNTVPTECTGKKDVTEDLHDLYRDLDSLLAASKLPAEQKSGLKTLFDEFWRVEGGANPKALSFVSCDKIHLSLLLTGESAESYIDHEHNELGLSADNADLINKFRSRKRAEDLMRLLQLLMHEKRHITLGRQLRVSPTALKPGRDAGAVDQAEYRAQEILTTAEEIAVGRKSLGGVFRVEPDVQSKLFRLRNMIRGLVTEQEYQRLRGVIIAQLRRRYGFDGGCDNALTLGVVSSMERGVWHICDYEAGRVATPIPDGLNICKGAESICKSRPPAPVPNPGGG